MRDQIHQLTSLRFVAAAVVVFYHFGRDTDFHRVLPAGFFAGKTMVAFFFVLSGFVLSCAYDQHRELHFGNYFSRRLARLCPVYFLGLAVVFFFAKWSSNLGSLLVHGLFLQSWIPGFELALNAPGWSLSVEMFLYVVFPVVLGLSRRSTLLKFICMSVAVWIVSQIWAAWWLSVPTITTSDTLKRLFTKHFPPLHLGSFLMGIAAAQLFTFRRSRFPEKRLPGWVFLLVYGVTVLSVNYVQLLEQYCWGVFPVSGGAGLLSPVFAVFLFVLASDRGRAATLLSAAPLVLLGEASYSLYILQYPVALCLEKLPMQVLPEDPETHFLVLFIVLIFVSVSSLIFFERPARRMILKRLQPQTAGSSVLPSVHG